MGETGEESRIKTKSSFGLKIFLVCLIVIIVGLAIAIIVVRSTKGNEENPEMSLEEFYEKNYADVDKIYDNKPENIGKVVDYFTEDINKKIDDDMAMWSAVQSEITWFKYRKIDNDGALLDGLARIDYSPLIVSERWYFYEIIIELAEKIGDNDKVNEYRNKLNEIRAEYIADLEVAKESLEKIVNDTEGIYPEDMKQEYNERYENIIQEIERVKE